MAQKPDRSRALFTDSRLYRQSAEMASALLEYSLPEDPLQAVQNIAFTNATSLTISEASQFDRPIRQLSNHLTKLARQASAHHFIPVLHEAVPRYYTEHADTKPFWIGSALKLAAGALWTEMMALHAVGSKSQQSLIDLVIAAGAFDSLLISKSIMTGTVGEGEITYGSGQARWNDAFERMRMLFGRAFYRRGRVQRFSELLSEAMFEGEGALTRLALLRLNGSIETVQARPESLFRVLSRVTDQDFWAGVLARLMLGALASDARGAVYPEDVLNGVAILETIATPSLVAKEVDSMIQRHTVSLFWQTQWRRSLDFFDLRQAFVDRPVMRIDRMREVFATSPFNVLDSLTSYFEAAAYGLQTDRRLGGVESVYRLLFSRPFEDDVQNYLRSRGFRAGHVSEVGAWLTQDGIIDMREQAGPPPGEIDVLGIDSDKHALIIECKCLKLPYNLSRLQTLLGGLGEEDASGYLHNLLRKAEWFRKTKLGARVSNGLMVLVTDYPLNFRSWETEGVVIVDRELLPVLIDNFLPPSVT
jgi:hypothetical protein